MTHSNKVQEGSLDEILKILQQKKSILAERYKVKSLCLFGSRVRAEAHENGDVDIPFNRKLYIRQIP